jgi:hypothetical protein
MANGLPLITLCHPRLPPCSSIRSSLSALSQRLASELILIDINEDLAKAEAEDISHAAAYLGNPRIVGTKGEIRSGGEEGRKIVEINERVSRSDSDEARSVTTIHGNNVEANGSISYNLYKNE